MTQFNIVFGRNNMLINFGDVSYFNLINLCGFVPIFNFPRRFGLIPDGSEPNLQASSLSMRFYSLNDVIVTINGEVCYQGDFEAAWNNHVYYNFFTDMIDQLRDERDNEEEIEYASDDEIGPGVVLEILAIPDQLEHLVRELDFLNLFEDYLDQLDSKMNAALEAKDT